MIDKGKYMGQVFTPKRIADIIACWTIRSKDDTVLDPAAGAGIFIESAIQRLRQLGSMNPYSQITAIELDEGLAEVLLNRYGKMGVRILIGNFFSYKPQSALIKNDKNEVLPSFDAVIGNPPYIERQLIPYYDQLRRMFPDIPALSDLYVYFIVYGSRFLKAGGRLGFIVSDSWLTAKYGGFLKKFLLNGLRLRYVVYFDKRVFEGRLVSSTIILAEKSPHPIRDVKFVRLRDIDEDSLRALERILCSSEKENVNSGNISIVEVPIEQLSTNESWLPYALALKYYSRLRTHPLLVPLKEIARVNIGLFTLANEFYIISEERRKILGIEEEFLRKIVTSPREIRSPILDSNYLTNYVLYCDKPKELLKETNVLKYVEEGERRPVRIRGKNIVVYGFHNTPRIKRSGRKPWYNLVPEIEERCRGSILIPRRIYGRYFAVWNKDRIVASDNFIVIEPKKEEFVLPLLAVLNSSIGEYFMRVMGHLYGGGVCDLMPDAVKRVPVIDLTKLSRDTLERLEKAFIEYSKSLDRTRIDEIIVEILGLLNQDYKNLLNELNEIVEIQKRRRNLKQ